MNSSSLDQFHQLKEESQISSQNSVDIYSQLKLIFEQAGLTILDWNKIHIQGKYKKMKQNISQNPILHYQPKIQTQLNQQFNEEQFVYQQQQQQQQQYKFSNKINDIENQNFQNDNGQFLEGKYQGKQYNFRYFDVPYENFEYVQSEILIFKQLEDSQFFQRLIGISFRVVQQNVQLFMINEPTEYDLESFIYLKGETDNEEIYIQMLKEIVQGFEQLIKLNIVPFDLSLDNFQIKESIENKKLRKQLKIVSSGIYQPPQLLQKENDINYYTPLEKLDGIQMNEKSLVWSLGLIIFEMFTKQNHIDDEFNVGFDKQAIHFAKLSIDNFLQEKIDIAMNFIDQAIKIEPQYSRAYNIKGSIYQHQKNFENALQFYDLAIQYNPLFYHAFYNKGNLLQEINKYKEAIQYYDKALALDSCSQLDLYFKKGLAHKHLQEYEQANTLFDKCLLLDDQYVEAIIEKGLILNDLDNYEEAGLHFDLAIEIDSENPKPYEFKAEIMYKQQQYRKSIDLLKKSLEYDLENLKLKQKLGFLYLKNNQFYSALENFNQILKIEPNNIDVLVNMGVIYQAQNKFTEALKKFSQAVKIFPGCQQALFNIGLILQQHFKYNESIQYYQIYTKLNQQNPDSYNNLGLAYMEIEQFEKAIKNFDKAIDLDPNHKTSLLNKSINNLEIQFNFLAIQNQYKNALIFIQGKILIDVYQDHSQAQLLLEKYMDLEQNVKEALVYLAKAYQMQNLYQKAILLYEKIQKLDPNDQQVQKKLNSCVLKFKNQKHK
ncbi:Protein kinase-like domain [Pseudocohnilembus persalinus]|uniref:Protein kinase-like domain n=1 Tax=Pseudocohnilembus persalinus TaxID=266149 RepID=A0A0V0QFC7_PSEPJ|nr:Protein kinase-like domain [Pseudocohnilembus persalinus]|eukprot:KRX00911.1 Protein kinase-like domain [Pseudocohnilembus persalinus]